MFNTIWFCLVLSTSHFTFFCFLFRLISSLRYKMHFSLSWFNVNRGLKWQVLVQDILLSPPRSSSNIFSLWGNLEGALKEQLVGFLSTNWLVLRFLSLAASWEHILRMDSGVAKVNLDLPVSLPIRSVNLAKTLLTLWTPSGGGEPEPCWFGPKKAKNATHRTQTGSTSASVSSNKTNWLPKGVKSYGSALFLKKSIIWGADLQCEMLIQQLTRLITNCT